MKWLICLLAMLLLALPVYADSAGRAKVALALATAPGPVQVVQPTVPESPQLPIAPSPKDDTYRNHAGMVWEWNGAKYIPVENGWKQCATGEWYKANCDCAVTGVCSCGTTCDCATKTPQPQYYLPLGTQQLQMMQFRGGSCAGGSCSSGG